MADASESGFAYSNVHLFREMAREAVDRVTAVDRRDRNPNPSGTGFIVRYDPKLESFKQSLVAIVFAWVYLEALLHIVITKRCGADSWGPRSGRGQVSWEERFERLGVTDRVVIEGFGRLRSARNELVHEKASREFPDIRLYAQEEAAHAWVVVQQAERALGLEAFVDSGIRKPLDGSGE